MIPPPDQQHAECRAIGSILSRIGDKWTVMVVGLLAVQPMRFNAIRRTIGGISQRMLTLTLRGLEEDGFVTRTVHPTVPPQVEYALTDFGRTLIVPLTALADWARTNQAAIEKTRGVAKMAKVPERPAVRAAADAGTRRRAR